MKDIKWLSNIFSSEDLSTDDFDLLSCSSDATGITGRALAVVWPREEVQIHKLIGMVRRKKLTLTLRGAGTGLAGGCVPDESIVVDMSRMNRIIEINPQEKFAMVQPGVVIDDLNYALDEYDLFFPIIPSSSSVCQAGGIAATDAAGLRAMEYGSAKDWISYVEMFDGTGKFLKLRYPQEIIGTEGILGIITGLKLKLTEPPGKKTLSLFKTDDVDQLMRHIKDYTGSPHISALEYINSITAKACGLKAKEHLIVEHNDDEGEFKDPEEIEKIWKMRKGLGPLLSGQGYLIMEDPKVPQQSLSKFIRWLNNNRIPAFGHIGIGIFHPRFKKSQYKLIQEMFSMVKKLGGEATGEHGIGMTKKQYINPVRLQELKDLKRRYDPEDIMNRGKIL